MGSAHRGRCGAAARSVAGLAARTHRSARARLDRGRGVAAADLPRLLPRLGLDAAGRAHRPAGRMACGAACGAMAARAGGHRHHSGAQGRALCVSGGARQPAPHQRGTAGGGARAWPVQAVAAAARAQRPAARTGSRVCHRLRRIAAQLRGGGHIGREQRFHHGHVCHLSGGQRHAAELSAGCGHVLAAARAGGSRAHPAAPRGATRQPAPDPGRQAPPCRAGAAAGQPSVAARRFADRAGPVRPGATQLRRTGRGLAQGGLDADCRVIAAAACRHRLFAATGAGGRQPDGGHRPADCLADRPPRSRGPPARRGLAGDDGVTAHRAGRRLSAGLQPALRAAVWRQPAAGHGLCGAGRARHQSRAHGAGGAVAPLTGRRGAGAWTVALANPAPYSFTAVVRRAVLWLAAGGAVDRVRAAGL